jgi:hypothetical protein
VVRDGLFVEVCWFRIEVVDFGRRKLTVCTYVGSILIGTMLVEKGGGGGLEWRFRRGVVK